MKTIANRSGDYSYVIGPHREPTGPDQVWRLVPRRVILPRIERRHGSGRQVW